MRNHLKRLNQENFQILSVAHNHRSDWSSLKALATSILEEIKESAEKVGYYDKLYMLDNQNPLVNELGQFDNFIQFYIGNRASGRKHIASAKWM